MAELKAHGMGLILDIVPNHMGVGHGDNPWWQDVLQNGRTSAYADFFDIDWEPLKPELRNKVLIPILGNPYGEDLEHGNIKVAFEDGRFIVKYFDKVLPIDPQTIPADLRSGQKIDTSRTATGTPDAAELTSLLEAFRQLPANHVTDPERGARRQGEIPPLLERLAESRRGLQSRSVTQLRKPCAC